MSPGTNVAERCSAYRTHVEQAITRDELNSIRLHIQRIPTGRSASARPSKRNYRVAPVPPRSAGQGSLHPLRKVRTAPCFADPCFVCFDLMTTAVVYRGIQQASQTVTFPAECITRYHTRSLCRH